MRGEEDHFGGVAAGVHSASLQDAAPRSSSIPAGAPRLGAHLERLLSILTVVLPSGVLTWSWWTRPELYGFHDWDVQASHRYLTRLAIRDYGELPAWNPFACGGFPAWGYVESGTAVVSPWLPFYLFSDLRFAMRVEMTGMALLGAAGTYALAGMFGSSRAARALAVALYACNGRFGLQLAAGHTWHLAYALLPWALFFFLRALDGAASRARRSTLALGGVLAMLVYTGGIYPLPHTGLALSLIAAIASVHRRSARPLVILGAASLTGFGLAAPKLLPLLSTFGRAPRLIESSESFSLSALFTALTSRRQAFFDRPALVSPYGWHEWGIYVSLLGLIAIVLGIVLARGERARTLAALTCVFVVLGLGAFHRFAPWTLLHEHAPVFRSQHVPSRFLYPATLFGGLCAAALLDRALTRFAPMRPWLGPLASTVVLGLALDVAFVAAKPMKDAIWMEAPDGIARAPEFHHVSDPPVAYKRRDWAGPMYLAMLANKGVLKCYGAPPFEGQGAIAERDRRFTGEVSLIPKAPEAPSIVRFSPSRATIALSPAAAGSTLVYNMNFDPGWGAEVRVGDRVLEASVVDRDARVAVLLPAGATEVQVRYRPPGLRLGLALAALTTLAWAAVLRVRLRRRGALLVGRARRLRAS